MYKERHEWMETAALLKVYLVTFNGVGNVGVVIEEGIGHQHGIPAAGYAVFPNPFISTLVIRILVVFHSDVEGVGVRALGTQADYSSYRR